MAPRKLRKQYTENDLIQSVAAVKLKQMTAREASKKFGVPSTTILDRVSGKYSAMMLKSGSKRSLTDDQEIRLVQFLMHRLRIGNDLPRSKIPPYIKLFLDSEESSSQNESNPGKKIFKNNLPSINWVHRFIDRHPDLRGTEESFKNTKKISREDLMKWFNYFSSFLLHEHGIVANDFLTMKNAHRIFNLGETGIPLTDKNKMKVITKRGSRYLGNSSSDAREQFTVTLCVSASGVFHKPLIVSPGVRANPEFDLNHVDQSKYNIRKTRKGLLSPELFYEWFTTMFYPSLNDIEFPILVFLDGQSSLLSHVLTEFCNTNRIILYCFPHNTSDIFQPIVTSVLAPFKEHFNITIKSLKDQDAALMNKSNFINVFDNAFEAVKEEASVISGFQKAGLVPFDQNALNYSELVPDDAPKENFKKLPSQESVGVKIGIAMALQIIEETIGEEKNNLFKQRYDEGFVSEDPSDAGQLYAVYKGVRMLMEDPMTDDEEEDMDTSQIPMFETRQQTSGDSSSKMDNSESTSILVEPKLEYFTFEDENFYQVPPT